MRRMAVIILTLLLVLLTAGCTQKTGDTMQSEKKAEPVLTSTPAIQNRENVNINETFPDIESELKDLEELEKSIQTINNITFQI